MTTQAIVLARSLVVMNCLVILGVIITERFNLKYRTDVYHPFASKYITPDKGPFNHIQNIGSS